MASGGSGLRLLKRPTCEERKALGLFLANRRARLRPVDLGLPADDKRRSPGLRREEVAVLAGVSSSWYTWLEQGRDIQASADALRRIADVLRLERVEATHLFALSSREAPSFAPSETVSDGMVALVNQLNPTAAYIRNARLDILAWNSAICDLLVDYSALQPHERNTLRLLFLHKPYRTLIIDWEQMTRGMLQTFRASRAKAQDKAPFDCLVNELSAASPEFRDWWPEVEVKGFEEGRKRLQHPKLGRVDFTFVALVPEGRPDLFLTVYIPGRDGSKTVP